MKKIDIYVIKAITNMHVGSGDSNYNIIDNQVQRDVVTKFPTINSSSLKGALREHFKSEEEFVNSAFGSENDQKPGKFAFFSGNFLSIPIRSDKKPYFMATCPKIIEEFLEFSKNLNYDLKLKETIEQLKKMIQNEDVVIFEDIKDINVEEKKAVSKEFEKINDLENLFGKNIALVSDSEFSKLVSDLPVIARNKLGNGESKNLWYEEIVPRESRFYTAVLKENIKEDIFEKKLKEIVQIGGNATIGYGYTKIQNLKEVLGE